MIPLSPVIGGVGTITDDEQWLLSIYPNLSAPAINSKNQGYVTLHRTLTLEQAIAYWRDENSIIATRPGAMVWDIRIDLDFGGRNWSLEIIARLRALFESKGLPRSVLCRSSDSEGRWLVIPLPEPMPSWQASLTAASILTDAGYQIENGHLEISPNVKRWVNRGKEAPKGIKSDWIIDHNAFRLPCQNGFEILDSDGETIGLTLAEYRHHWEWAQSQQCPDEWQATVDYYSQKENRPKFFKPRGKGTIGEIEREHLELCSLGFTDTSQTNDIGLNLARRLRMLYPGDEEHQAELIKQAFISMPGYKEHCHHQHEIDRRGRDLARWADKNWSYYGDRLQKPTEEPKPNQNLARHTKTVDKLTRVLMDWITNGFTFTSQNQIFEALKRHCGVGKKTFYKYLKELANFATLIKKLLNPENHTGQDFHDQFTPSTTKRTNCCASPSGASAAQHQSEEKKYLIPDSGGTSTSVDYQLSNTATGSTQRQTQDKDLAVVLEQFAESVKQPTAPLESESVVQAIALEKGTKTHQKEPLTEKSWVTQKSPKVTTLGKKSGTPEYSRVSESQQVPKRTGAYQRKTHHNSPQLTASEKNPVTESYRKLPECTDQKETEINPNQLSSIAPKFSKGQSVWFWNGVQWLQGTIERVITGVRNEYNVLDFKGWGLFVSETAIAPM
ncbi:hypothetical protein [[Limnothrix rosea] IAM M-220]|uniref:hypothetical protein n=1 Tax=[Limnothrix rosea] IAM M-220 TaxID=454133 RepID=UPI0009592B69|nr:hypothetical protein [[Limnothrix rosea] IAM M-220]OKH11170.1 hypothetical protein NIES208_17620 [[Limnothrix rosea] IAM M-220]